MKEPDKNIYTDGDRTNYAEILEKTSAMKHGNNPASNKPKSSKGFKYKTTRMWANAQRDGRPAEHRWRPLFNAAKFG